MNLWIQCVSKFLAGGSGPLLFDASNYLQGSGEERAPKRRLIKETKVASLPIRHLGRIYQRICTGLVLAASDLCRH